MEAVTRPELIRVVLTGSESTGKTTLAERLAAHYNVDWVPEFVRDFAARKGTPIEFSDHGAIARGQIELEDHYASRGGRLLVQDTDLVSTVIYCEHYFGRVPKWIEDEARTRRPRLYLVMDIDHPWVADQVRDRGHVREAMHELFIAGLDRLDAEYRIIRGSPDERFARAIAEIDSILDR
jgi:HTH-type transcriptional repressor of NAD biosynthesis genes